jgi:diguanylate cyclase (GGDEF)-like protein
VRAGVGDDGEIGWRGSQPWSTWAFTGVLALATAASCPAVLALRRPSAPRAVPWLLLAAGFAVGQVVALRFEWSGESHVVSLSEVPLLIGLVFASTEQLLVATVIGTAVGVAWRRRPPIKAVFNLLTRVVETVVASLCFYAVLGSAGALTARGWLAAFLALPAADLVSAVCVQIVIGLSLDRFTRTGLKTLAVVLVGVAFLNVAVGSVAVVCLWADPWAIIPLLGIVALIGIGYDLHGSLRQRHSDLEEVYRFGRTVAALVESDQVIEAVLSEARRRLRCRHAELVLNGRDGAIQYALSGDGSTPRRSYPATNPFRGSVSATGASVLALASTRDSESAQALMESGFSDAVAVPVVGDNGVAGMLMVADRLGDRVSFEGQDVGLLEALASHASMALRSSQLFDRLRIEVATKNHQSLHDGLTGLANRTLFAEQVTAALDARSEGSVVAVMLMDLDRFKEVNDTLGHYTGDLMLQQIAAQLDFAVAGKGSVARLGGDEFAFVIPAATEHDVLAIAREVLAGAQATVVVEGLRLEVRASLGVAVDPDNGSDRSTLLRQADIAMYRAKSNGTGIEVYHPERDPHSTRRLVLATELRLALETSSIGLYYQPKAELGSGRVSGVEALLRWTHPVYGPVAPDEFIPLAEQSGLIRPLTLWVLKKGLSQLAAWVRDGFDLTLAVNLSARSVFDTDLAQDVYRLLHDCHLRAADLTIEITESSIFTERPTERSVIDDLAHLGVQLSIDDFGTGYSSLSRLERLPVHEVKIDKSFVTGMLDNGGHDAIVRSTIDLARNLNLRVVAEGVEDKVTWDRLAHLGCTAAQGYYLSKPMCASSLGAWLSQRTPQRHPVTPERACAPDADV